ncbi:peptidoglycan-binding protein [Sinomonas sp. P47F7]|uniref:peptidoglycan-binding protein n=1 Tax=Sinomonas sp. P47F7 TaxID=3410987 RepID=UPI003BF490A8
MAFVFPQLRTPQQVAAEAAPPSSSAITATAERRALTAKVVVRAIVAPGATVDLKPSDALVAAGMVVTAIPAASEGSVATGAVVVEANGEPLIAMNWPFPAYRDIHADDSGPDVVQLQKTLANLGYAAGGTGTFDARTRSGLKQLYAKLGYKVPTAESPLGVGGGAAATATPSSAGGRAGGGGGSANGAGQKEVFLPARSVLVMPSSRSTLTSIPIKVGQKIGGDTVLAKLDGQASTVVASTTADRAAKLKPGAAGTLTGAAGEQYPVKVSAVASSVGEVPGLGQGVRIDLSFVDPARIAPVSAAGTSTRLEISTGSTAEGLVLPITAVYSTQDGASYVIPASDQNRRITVITGANIDGWVEIKPGSELKEGDAVVLGTLSAG